jgi:hypothetical protein
MRKNPEQRIVFASDTSGAINDKTFTFHFRHADDTVDWRESLAPDAAPSGYLLPLVNRSRQ